MKKISILQLIPITAAFIMLSISGCDKPDKISKWRYVPKEIDGAEVILTINETQGMAEVACFPKVLYNSILRDSIYYHFWFKDGWHYQMKADTLFLQLYVEHTGQNIIGKQRMVITEKSNHLLEVESIGFYESYAFAPNHIYVKKYDFIRLP